MRVVTGLNEEDRFTVVRVQQFVMFLHNPRLHACYNGMRNVDTRILTFSESELYHLSVYV